MIFADGEVKKPVRMLVNEFGVEFDQAGYEVRDYSTNANEQINLVYTKNFFEPFTSTSKGIFS